MRTGLVAAQAVEVAQVVVYGGRHEQQTIEAIQQTAVSWQARAHVFDAQVPLDRGEHQITKLPKNADEQAQRQQVTGMIDARARKDEPPNTKTSSVVSTAAPAAPPIVLFGLV